MNEQQEHEIIRRWRAGQSQRGIARDLGLSRKRVRQAVKRHEQGRQSGVTHPDLPAPAGPRSSLVDAHEGAIRQWLERYPNITAVRLYEELRKQGYQGGYTVLRQRVKQLRTRPPREAVIRFETSPGAQAQMDWSVYELEFTHEGRRRVNLFSYVLGYSRRQYLAFTEQQDLETTLRQHVRAFEHLGGVAATCLYDNMKVVVQRWEDDQPLYNPRFLAFATHYGFRPQACRPRRPQTKGKVERPFYYVETNLLNGRTFRSLEHLNEVARWWLEHAADVRLHRETKRRPLDAHAEELPHLLPLPAHPYDTAQVVYRMANADGFLLYRQNRYSIPWRYVGDVLPVRITEDHLVVYNAGVEEIARHALLPASQAGGERLDPAHRPPRDQQQQLETLRQRFAELGEFGSRFLECLLAKQRCGKHQAQRVLAVLHSYHRADVLAALERAVRYQACSLASLERILATQATPKAPWASLSEDQQQWLRDLTGPDSPAARPSSDYQSLLFEETPDDEPPSPTAP